MAGKARERCWRVQLGVIGTKRVLTHSGLVPEGVVSDSMKDA